jgi:L-aspartate oxidase
MALRAGVPVADVEFFQFHPTALHHPAVPRPLLSEALRGHGAILRDAGGERFVDELAPRDVVSRAMAERMTAAGVSHLWLDATGLEAFDERFPTLAERLSAAGLDPAVDWLPIAPAAHYLSGGVITDLDGASALPGLWAAGEAACTGVHGANRLASNSLLEGMVFGARLAEAIEEGRDEPVRTGVMRALLDGASTSDIGCRAMDGLPTPSWVTRRGRHEGGDDVTKNRDRLQRAMTEGAGVLRSAASLAAAAEEVGDVAATAASWPAGRAAGEVANLAAVAGALLRAAEARVETRGAHARAEYPESRPDWRCRLVHGHVPGVRPASVSAPGPAETGTTETGPGTGSGTP